MCETEQRGEVLGPIMSSTEEEQWVPGKDVSPEVLLDAFELFRRKRKLGRVMTVNLLGKSSILVDWTAPKGKRPVATKVEIRPFNGRTKMEMYTRNFFLGCLRHLVEGTPIPAQRLKPRKPKVVEAPPPVEPSIPDTPVEELPVSEEANEALTTTFVIQVSTELQRARKDAELRHTAIMDGFEQQGEALRELRDQFARSSEGVWRMVGMIVELMKAKKDDEAVQETITRIEKELGKQGRS
jgi:hypothetical protein